MKKIKKQASVSREVYSVSISDLMSCLVFVFIIAVIILAKRFLTYQTQVGKAGGIICQELKHKLGAAAAKEIECDADTHTLRMGERVLFSSGQYKLTSAASRKILAKIGGGLKDIISCGDQTPGQLKNICRDGKMPLEAILIEGHTDNMPPSDKLKNQCFVNRRKKCIPDNITLSSFRAIEVYEHIKGSLGEYGTHNGKNLIGVAGYGSDRALKRCSLDDRLCRKINRRIEIRFVMSAYDTMGRAEPSK